MVKKIIVSLLVLFTITLTLILPTSAAPSNIKVSFSEDFSTANYEGEEYTRINLDGFLQPLNPVHESNLDIKLSNNQKNTIKKIEILDDYGVMFRANISFKDGGYYQAEYINNRYLNDYNVLKSDKPPKVKIRFDYPGGNTVTTNMSELKSDVSELVEVSNKHKKFFVLSYNKEKRLAYEKGVLIIDSDDNCYYAEFNDEFTADDVDSYSTHFTYAFVIKDEELLSKIDDAMDKYYDSDFGILEDDDFSDRISSVMIIFIFAVVPLGLMILFLIAAIKSKTSYKKLFTIIYILCILEIIVFAALFIIMLLK